MQEFLPNFCERIILVIGGSFGWLMSNLFGNHQQAVLWLLAIMIFDFMIGTLKACQFSEWSSGKCSKGLIKKFFIVAIVVCSHGLDIITGFDCIQTMFMSAFAFSEVGSIIESLTQMGYADIVPERIQKFLSEAKERPVQPPRV